MDADSVAAAKALANGDPLGALQRIGLRDDATALALRGMAMAQLEQLPAATTLLRRAARQFGSGHAVARARCQLALAEIALVSRDLAALDRTIDSARRTLDHHGDHANAAYAAQLDVRRLVLIGRIDAAQRALASQSATRLPAKLKATHELLVAGLALRQRQASVARQALARAGRAAQASGVVALIGEVDHVLRGLDMPAARLTLGGDARLVTLDEVERLLHSRVLIVDACRNAVQRGVTRVALASRPVLFSLIRVLGAAWPGGATREELLIAAFGARQADESHRARLRVEIARLRRAIAALGRIDATADGFQLSPVRARAVAVLTWPEAESHTDVLALLADGESWSTSALALALGASQRTVQRALESLATSGKAQLHGRGRARRWTVTLVPAFATTMLLPVHPTLD